MNVSSEVSVVSEMIVNQVILERGQEGLGTGVSTERMENGTGEKGEVGRWGIREEIGR